MSERLVDFLSVRDISAEAWRGLLDVGHQWKADPARYADTMRGKVVAMLFEKPSLRTRVSFEVGLVKLGAHAMYFDCAQQRVGQRESVKDYAKNLERYVDGVVARVHGHSVLVELAEHATIPIINALSDEEHPCQALADMLTLSEHLTGQKGPGADLGALAGKRLVWVGDGNNVCHSLLFACAKLGVSMTVITPKGFEPDFAMLKAASSEASASGATISLEHDLGAIEGHDAVYTDTWVSMGQQHQGGLRGEAFSRFHVDAEMMQRAGRGLDRPSIFMHCLPVHRGEEVADEVIDGPASVVYDQAENRMHAQVGLLLKIYGQGESEH